MVNLKYSTKISKYSHGAVVFQELLAMETQGHLRGDQWVG